jgi:hypothetical protein
LTIADRSRGAAIAASILLGTTVQAGERDGGLMGWVESTRGVPVGGAVVSVFGKGIRGGSLVTVADSAGQFTLPALPAGSYTIRALGTGHEPAMARKITVLPERDSVFTVSLTPIGEAPAPAEKADAAAAESPETLSVREWEWLVRHRRRSVLESGEDEPVPLEPPPSAVVLAARGAWVPELAGSVELVTSPAALGLDTESFGTDTGSPSQGALRLQGRLADSGRWSLGGLVTEAETRTWRMGAEFVLEPGGGHEIQTGAAYGTNYLRSTLASSDTLVQHSVGAAFVKDRFAIGRSTYATLGARYAYMGFLDDRNHVDTTAAVEYHEDEHAVLRATVASRTLAPGGDLLTLSTLKTSPMASDAHFDDGLRPSRTWRYELAADRALGAAKVGAHLFYESTADQLVNVFDQSATPVLHVMNGGNLDARGLGLTVGGHLGDVVNGSITYTYGRTTRNGGLARASDMASTWDVLGYEEADYHDLVARVETFIDWSDTRVSAYYRINTLNPEPDGRVGGHSACTNTRFDVQLTQGLPFLQTLTRADWEVLVAFRNLFYEAAEGAALDELVVLHPPKRVMGGISVRF